MRALFAVLGRVGICLTSGPHWPTQALCTRRKWALASWYGKPHQGGERRPSGSILYGDN